MSTTVVYKASLHLLSHLTPQFTLWCREGRWSEHLHFPDKTIERSDLSKLTKEVAEPKPEARSSGHKCYTLSVFPCSSRVFLTQTQSFGIHIVGVEGK